MIDLGVTLDRWHWRNWSVLVKVVAVLLVPTLVALVVGMVQVLAQAGAAHGYARISEVVGVQQKLSGLIGAMQRERDLAAEFVATGRSGDRVPLEEQFRLLATRSAEVRTAAERVENLSATGYRLALDQLRALRTLRDSVLTGTSPVEVVVTEYGVAIDPLIALDADLVRTIDDGAVAGDAAAAHALLVSREQVSRQRAIVAAALPGNQITSTQIDDVQAAAVRLSAEQDAFTAVLEPAERAGYGGQALGEAELSRRRLLQLVLDRGSVGGPLDISATDWSARSESALGDLVTVENGLRERIERTALERRDDVRATAGWNVIFLIFALSLGVVIGILIARSILRPLGVLTRSALDVANRWLPATIILVRGGHVPDQAIEPVAISTHEEIGQVARSFDEVHREVMRLASEQAQLRAHINDIFINLSRRSQGLVERQLQLIDRLESAEQDPELLGNLFQLDHLATRMRRNNDNLLVLAGTEATKRTSRPVRLVDVLRAAVSEVEQYQRLTLRQPPDVLMLGRAAGDLVHLLAEVLDNATQFSPPDTRVVVTAQFAPDGSVVIEVTDRGVGMTDPELADANERLAGTPVVDTSVSRRMGLFVVGRLAVRHGVEVRLRRGDDGLGVCASVRVPAWLARAVPVIGDAPSVPVLPGPPEAGSESASSGNGVRLAGPADSRDSPLPRRNADRRGGELRGGERPGPPVPPVPSGPPVSPPVTLPDLDSGTLPDLDSGGALFRPPPQDDVPMPPTSTEVTLQHSTPIFDDVASAWFREYQAVPVGWAAAASPAHSKGRPAIPAGEPVPVAAGQQPGPVPGGHQGDPVADPQREWGAADEGWRAARALTRPASDEVTAAGLPRRRPRALLVPGAVGAALSADPAGGPVRSAERIRSRLASYQQGVREGRQTQRNHHDQDDPDKPGPHQQQNAAEETE